MSRLAMAARLARRELRGGLGGFIVFLICLSLGVAAISGVGMVRGAIQRGLTEQGAQILGGDAMARFTYRFASAEERAWMQGVAVDLSEVVEFRSMIAVGGQSVLVQAKAVDAAYPLIGTVELAGGQALDQALAGDGGLPGLVAEQVLVDQLGLKLGDRITLGGVETVLGGILLREPDSAVGGFAFAPRVLIRRAALEGSPLLAPGTLFDSAYRMILPAGADLAAVKAEAEARFRDAGLRWADRTRAAPGVDRFVERIGSFLVLVGLAGLAVGGVGIASAVRAYLEGKIATIATLRVLGADGRVIFLSYLIQIAVLALAGIAIGLVLGIGVPMLAKPLIEAALPFPADIRPGIAPVAEAVFYGLLSAFVFALWPLARAEGIRAAALYRGEAQAGLPRPVYLVTIAALTAALVLGAGLFSGLWMLTLGVAAGVAGALLLLAGIGWGLMRLARRLARARIARGRPWLRVALAALGAPRSEAMQVVLALGLGLTVLASVGQIEANLRAAIDNDLPERAPAFFFVDIQPDQLDPFSQTVRARPEVTKMETAPMLRGVLIRINGEDARKVAGDHWVVQGDRGITYAGAMPEGTRLTEGEWWDADHAGETQISFSREEAEEIGLKLGDRLTVTVLGREVEGIVTSFREVDFSTGGIGFVMVFSPEKLRNAPQSHIATVYLPPEAEAGLLRAVSGAFPNVTAIGIRAAAARVSDALRAIAQATMIAAAATLATGFAVLVGAAAAGEPARRQEAAVLKVLGAARRGILGSFALRALLVGAAAGGIAVLAGSLSAFAVMHWVMEAEYRFFAGSAAAIVLGGVLTVVAAGLFFSLRVLRVAPARVLRSVE